MKVHLSWIGVVALAAAAINVNQAGAQYAPYRPQQQPAPQAGGYPQASVYPTTYPATAQPTAPAMNRYQMPAAPVAPATAPAPAYPQYSQTVAPPATQIPAYSYPQTTYPQVAQAPSYPSYGGYPAYPSVAQQPVPPAPTEGEGLPAPVPTPNEKSMATPNVDSANGAAAVMAPTNGGMNGYSSTGYQTANGYSGYGQGSCGYTDYGINGCCEQDGGNGHVWFGGAYWLFMERDNPNTRKLTVRVDHNVAPDPYYPQANVTVLDTDRTDFDFQDGVEVRFGCTFGIGDGCDDNCGYGNACGGNGCNGCGNCPSDNYAWEVAWWGLDEDHQATTYYDQDPLNEIRLYGMVNFAGIEYYDGANWRPVNEYYGYGLPIPDPGAPADGDLIVMGQRTRSYFSAQNLELNFIRFPVCESGCGGGCGGCSTCGSGSAGYGTDCGYGACGCESDCCPIAFSMCGMCGVRYFRIDDDFYYGSQWAMWDTGAYLPSSWINYDLSVDNNLIGPQVGWNMNYCVGCKWNFFCNSTFGVFNNHIESHQRVWGETGRTRYIQTGQNNNINSTKDDISFLGELRLGGSYDVSCNWRAVLAYRALAITGIANSVDQIPTDFTNAQYPGIIDSDSSIIIHGVQAGMECRY